MKKLLITGFEPFDGEEINPSWEAVKLLPSVISDFALTKLQIPVLFGKASDMVFALADEIHPDVILCIGQAGGRSEITPEYVAINLRYAKIPDNRGYQPKDEAVIEGGENAYFSTIPTRKIAEALSAASINAKVSYSAGTYVCNDLLYSLLACYKDSDTKVGFIHIPYCSEQHKEPSMEIDEIVRGLILAIETI